MKVLHINDHLEFKGGVEVYVLSLAAELEGRGVEVGIAFGQGSASAWPRSFSVPSVSSVAWRSREDGRREMERVLKSFAPDVCHVHGVFNPGSIQACLDYGPTILHLHDYRYVCPSSGLYYRRSESICERTCSLACFPIGLVRGCQTLRMPASLSFYSRVRFVERNANRFRSVLANSQYVADRFTRSNGIVSRLQVLHYFCPIEPAMESPAGSEVSSILFLGRVREPKGIVRFIDVLSRLPERVIGTIVGDPDSAMRAIIEKEARRLKCWHRVKMTGWVERADVAKIVEQAGAVIFPSIWAEPFGIVGLEAMARGIPVVAFDVGGVSDWLKDGVNGFLIPRDDTRMMAERVQELLSDPSLRSKFGNAGISTVRSQFDLDGHIMKLLSLYEG
jgi:glycosyltransferase involved in cell wall biosynthesis